MPRNGGRQACGINVLQAYYMLAADGYMAEDRGSIRLFAVSASISDSAVKQVYE